VQIDDLLTFRQFTKKATADVIDVCISSNQAALKFHSGFNSMTKTSDGRRGQEKCTKTSYPTSVVSHS
jgi:hypothetical protein